MDVSIPSSFSSAEPAITLLQRPEMYMQPSSTSQGIRGWQLSGMWAKESPLIETQLEL